MSDEGNSRKHATHPGMGSRHAYSAVHAPAHVYDEMDLGRSEPLFAAPGMKMPEDITRVDDPLGENDPWSRLEVKLCGKASLLTASRSVLPLRMVNPKVHGQTCQVRLSHYGGGMLEGDTVLLKVSCGQDTRLIMDSVGSLQIHRSESKGSSQRIEGFLESDALAVIAPDPVVPHAGSMYRHSQEWHVHPRSSLLMAELMTGGRLESGERFLFKEYSSDVTVFVGERLVLRDAFSFIPSVHSYADPALFAGRSYLLSLYGIGQRWQDLADVLSEASMAYQSDAGETMLSSLHPLQNHGYVFRAVAGRLSDLNRILDLLFEFLAHGEFLGFNPRARKY